VRFKKASLHGGLRPVFKRRHLIARTGSGSTPSFWPVPVQCRGFDGTGCTTAHRVWHSTAGDVRQVAKGFGPRQSLWKLHPEYGPLKAAQVDNRGVVAYYISLG